MIYRRFCLEGVARSRVTDKIEALRVCWVAANILSLGLFPPNWGLGDGQTTFHGTILIHNKYFTRRENV